MQVSLAEATLGVDVEGLVEEEVNGEQRSDLVSCLYTRICCCCYVHVKCCCYCFLCTLKRDGGVVFSW